MRRTLRPPATACAFVALALALSCMRSLPDQDRRIIETQPSAKLTSDMLLKEYQDNKGDANRKYWGQAIEISGTVGRVESVGASSAILFGQGQHAAVRANLLDDRAAAIVAETAPGQRLTLRCFCEGLQAGDVVLKSCIKP